MDIGDLILPLLIIGGVIVQWLTNQAEQKKKKEKDRGSSFPSDSGVPDEVEANDPFDELMEALGRAAGSEEGSGRSSGSPAPPPIPRESRPMMETWEEPSPPERTPAFAPAVDPLQRQREILEAKKKEAEQVRKKRKRFNSTAGGELFQGHSMLRQAGLEARAGRIRSALRDRDDIRQAILLNEILQKPVSLR